MVTSKTAKCFSCGKDLIVTDVIINSHIKGRTLTGCLISGGAYPDDDMELRMRCVYCGTEYLINGYKHYLEKLMEWL